MKNRSLWGLIIAFIFQILLLFFLNISVLDKNLTTYCYLYLVGLAGYFPFMFINKARAKETTWTSYEVMNGFECPIISYFFVFWVVMIILGGETCFLLLILETRDNFEYIRS